MNPEPEFLNLEDVLQIHDQQLTAYGGVTGIRDRGLLESAVMMPQASFGEAYLHEDLAHMAAAEARSMENNFQLVSSFSNAHVGREFEEAAVIAEVFNKTTRTTPAGVLATCQRRSRMYDANI